jgi:hypothetical protein
MAQPPAAVVRTLKPVGELQLHRLDKRARFHCVHCRRDKTHSLVATMNGDWAQTVCVGCYGILVRAHGGKTKAQREEAKKAAEAEKKLKRRLPGIDGLLAFFRAAGVDVELVHGGYLRIDGIQTQPLTHLPPPETLEWKTIVDEMALKYVGGKFIRVMKDNARFGEDLRALLLRRERGFTIMRDDVRLAIIHPTHAQALHRDVIHANFLMPGPHWQYLADVLHDAEPELVAEWKYEQEAKAAAEPAAAAAKTERSRAAARRRIDQLPDDLAPELIGACLDASRRIRLERRLDYGHTPVILECDVGELTLLPIAGPESRLLVPFRLSKGTETLAGQLILGNRDPLPVLIGEDVADEDAITAWTWALLGFADATCVELDPAEPTARREPARPRRRPRSSASHPRRPAQTLPSKPRWPSYLEPVGSHTIDYVNSLVRGHRRRLPYGHIASDEQRDLARRIGIILRPNETWVQSHARGRGLPPGVEMRFLWHAPTQLELSQTQPTGRGEGGIRDPV